MIIANGKYGNDRLMIMLGLSHKNINRMMTGQPILVKSDTHPGIPSDLAIVICCGETEESIKNELEKLGALEGVPIIKDKRL